jgi:hypothetical protein
MRLPGFSASMSFPRSNQILNANVKYLGAQGIVPERACKCDDCRQFPALRWYCTGYVCAPEREWTYRGWSSRPLMASSPEVVQPT